MRSPFPGMDPWLELHWRDVHSRLIIRMNRAITRAGAGTTRPCAKVWTFSSTPASTYCLAERGPEGSRRLQPTDGSVREQRVAERRLKARFYSRWPQPLSDCNPIYRSKGIDRVLTNGISGVAPRRGSNGTSIRWLKPTATFAASLREAISGRRLTQNTQAPGREWPIAAKPQR
jgi:hypothetical protein